MSDTQATDQPEINEDDPGSNSCRACSVGCLGILILAGVALGLVSSDAGGGLDARLAEVSFEVVELQDKADSPRGTILGTPENEDNAAADYNGFSWALAAGTPAQLPESWRNQRPQLPVDIDEMVKQIAPGGKAIDPIDSAYLVAILNPNFDLAAMRPSEVKRFQKSQKMFARVRPVLRYIRDGLSRGKCDWSTRWEMGMRLEVPNLMHMRAAGNLMAYEATLQPPSAAIQTGLEIVAFGADIGRHGTLIGAMMGVAVSHIGFLSLRHTLDRPDIEAHDCQRVIDVLSGFQTVTGEEMIQGERVAMVVGFLEMSGRPLDLTPDVEAVTLDDMGGGAKLIGGLDVVYQRELEAYEAALDRALKVIALPRDQRRDAAQQLSRDLEQSYNPAASVMLPNFDELIKQLERTLGMSRVVRALAAAQQVRLKEGAFPTSIQRLAGALGPGIEDPTATAPGPALGYAYTAPYLRCWIRSDNGGDEGGPALELPRPKWVKRTKKKRRVKKKRKKATSPRIGGRGDDYGFQLLDPGATSSPVPAPR